jgi:hypothetical protein
MSLSSSFESNTQELALLTERHRPGVGGGRASPTKCNCKSWEGARALARAVRLPGLAPPGPLELSAP